MKLIYKVLYPLGYEEHEVEEGFPTTLPFVEIKPLESLSDSQSQFFNFTENKWELLENLSTGLQVDNEALKKANEELASKAESLAQINSKTMLTSLQKTKDIATIKEQLEGGE